MRKITKKIKPQRTQRLREKEVEYSVYPFRAITEEIISCAIEVHSALGPGLLESIYEEALEHEFQLRKIKYERQKDINLFYKGKAIGTHRIDYLVSNEVILELKAVDTILKIHEAQLMTYLKAMNKRIGLIINFNVRMLKLGIKRKINDLTPRGINAPSF